MSLVEDVVRVRVEAMLIIFFVSLFAASFPSISKRTKVLRIPRIVFFIGKHFGTGVILSTAFVHLLQDAFSSLQSPAVDARWKTGHWTGLIVLGSLISIFLVEYLSTSYVDRLYSYPSLTSSPEGSHPSSPIPSSPIHIPSDILDSNYDAQLSPSRTTELTPLIQDTTIPISNNNPSTHADLPRRTQSLSYGARPPALHRHYSVPYSFPHTHVHNPNLQSDIHEHSDSRFFDGHHRHESKVRFWEHHDRSTRMAGATPIIYEPVLISMPRGRSSSRLVSPQAGEVEQDETASDEVVGSSGKHRHERHKHIHCHGTFGDTDIDERLGAHEGTCAGDDEAEVGVGQKRQIVGILVLQMGIMIHSLVIGLTLAITSGSEFTSLVTAIIFHQLFEGLSLGIRISSLPSAKADIRSKTRREHGEEGNHFPLLKATLMLLFAITTPVGIIIGLFLFAEGDTDIVQMKFTQGLMCAISAGMLIYAACVEMLAGDFVMDATLWRSPVWKQTLAIGSLLVGSGVMAVVGA